MRRRVNTLPYLLLLPFFVLFAMFFIGPLFYALYLSFHVERGPRLIFIGLRNYTRVLNDELFFQSIERVAYFGLIQIPLMLGLALFLALVLDVPRLRGREGYRLVYFLPYAVPGVIASLMWGYIYAPTIGPIRQLLRFLGFPEIDLLGRYLLQSIMNVVTWNWTGYNMVILYSGLKAIPGELFDAALVDGATGLSIARYVKIPLIRPQLVMATVFSIIGTFQLFTEPYALGTVTTVPYYYTPNLYIYSTAFGRGLFTYAATMSFVLASIIFAFSYAFMYFTRRASH